MEVMMYPVSPEVPLRRVDRLMIQLDESCGKVKAYMYALEVVNAAVEKSSGGHLVELREDVAAGMGKVVQEATQIAEALEHLDPGITQRLLDCQSSDDSD